MRNQSAILVTSCGLRDYGDVGQAWPEVTFPPVAGLPPLIIPAGVAALGMESDPWAYIGHLVALFREVRRVLADDGVLFLNLGDSYAANRTYQVSPTKWKTLEQGQSAAVPDGLKAKDLIGIPWRAAFALQADGWWLRSDCIWSKPNPMPESITDRPTKAHEYVFVLAKSARYFWDAEGVHQPVKVGGGSGKSSGNYATGTGTRNDQGQHLSGGFPTGSTRNLRTVWTIPTQPYPGAHFAVWPAALAERCILAGSRVGDTVLDPFSGSGTTSIAAVRLGRSCIGLEQSAEYAALSRERIPSEVGHTAETAMREKAAGVDLLAGLPLFGGAT